MTLLAVISADKEIVELARELGYDVVGFFDPDAGAAAGGAAHLGGDDRWRAAREARPGLRVALALDPPPAKRRALATYDESAFETLVSPAAHVSPSAALGAGCIVQRGVKVLADARVGSACKLNVDAVIHHDCTVGACCTLGPGARLLGNVVVGDDVFVGAAATVMPRVRIGNGATIGAGALVTHDVAAGVTVAGVPARPLRESP